MTNFEIIIKTYLKAVDEADVKNWLAEKLKGIHYEIQSISDYDGTILIKKEAD